MVEIDLIKLRKNLLNINVIFTSFILLSLAFFYFFSGGKIDYLLITASFVLIFIVFIPYFRDFSIDNFKLTFLLQAISIVILSFFMVKYNPMFIFYSFFSIIPFSFLNIFSKVEIYNTLFLILFFVINLSSVLINSKIFRNIKNVDDIVLGLIVFILILMILSLVIFRSIRNFVLDYYKSQVMDYAHKKIDEAQKIAYSKAKEAIEKNRFAVLLKEKQEKIFEINKLLASKVRNIKEQLEILGNEVKNVVFAHSVVILLERNKIINPEFVYEVPKPIVTKMKTLADQPSNSIINRFIREVFVKKITIHINKRKDIFYEGFEESGLAKEISIKFLEELSLMTYEVYEVLMVPIVDSLGNSIGVMVALNNKEDLFNDVDKMFLELLGVQAGILIHNAILLKKIEDAFNETIVAFSSAIEAKDKYTPVLHTTRVGELAAEIAKEMNLPPEEVEKIRIAGILHDIGKLAIPDSILAKQGPLTVEEREVIKTHSEEGYKILSKISLFRERGIPVYVLYHHERLDGKGYPRGISGRDLPLGANIISIADTYDAISTPRPYNKHYASEQKAIDIIKSERGKQFYPEVVDSFFRVLEKRKSKNLKLNQ
ncbi:MAG: HD domain-containing phosphohydrolase [bacterium]